MHAYSIFRLSEVRLSFSDALLTTYMVNVSQTLQLHLGLQQQLLLLRENLQHKQTNISGKQQQW